MLGSERSSVDAGWLSAKNTVLPGNSWISLTTLPAAHKKLPLSSETFKFLNFFGPIQTLGNFLNRETGFETLGRNSEIWLFRFSISYERISSHPAGVSKGLPRRVLTQCPVPPASCQLAAGISR